jgi:uncharacterized protein
MERKVRFASDGVMLSGIVRIPEGMKPGERRPAFIVLHGFGSNKEAGNVRAPVEMLSRAGYVTMRFDMRGCGESEGERGRLICLEQVDNTRAAIDLLSAQPEVDPGRIGLVGSSFGAAVALYTGGVDARVAAVISSGGWGNGERKFRGQHSAPGAWERFLDMLARGRRHKAETGKALMVGRYDIVPIPDHLRGHLSENSTLTFSCDTAQSMFEFNAEDVVTNIAPRPILLLHSSSDSVTPTEQSLAIYDRAGHPKDLHLFAETDHFMFDEKNTRVRNLVMDWLARFFPVTEAMDAGAETKAITGH